MRANLAKKNNKLFILILVVYALYAAAYIYRTSFVFDGQRYFALFDDAMISMRYARNLAQGEGLVWNPGEQVEGFSNPLWVLFMALLHLLPLPITHISLAVQVCGAILMMLSLVWLRRMAALVSPQNEFVPLTAMLMTAFYLPLNNWSLQGMEVSALLLLANISLYHTLRAQQLGVFSPWPLLLLGFSSWVRLDMVIMLVLVAAFLAWSDPKNRRRYLLWGALSLLFFLGVQTGLRWWYYGELLPNTYYLKLAGYPLLARLGRGTISFIRFAWNMNWLLFLMPFFYLLLRREKPVLLLSASFGIWAAYSLYVGGDAWEHHGGANRFIAIGMPAFFVLFAIAVHSLRSKLTQMLGQHHLLTAARLDLATAIFILLAMFNFNALVDVQTVANWLLLQPPQFVSGSKRYVEISRVLDEITTPEARIAVVTAGNIPYFSQHYTIDLLGKSDKVIARGKPHLSGLFDFDYRPGHDKWDVVYSIDTYQPDLIAQSWEGPGYMQEMRTAIKGKYLRIKVNNYAMWVREGSAYIHWDKVEIIY